MIVIENGTEITTQAETARAIKIEGKRTPGRRGKVEGEIKGEISIRAGEGIGTVRVTKKGGKEREGTTGTGVKIGVDIGDEILIKVEMKVEIARMIKKGGLKIKGMIRGKEEGELENSIRGGVKSDLGEEGVEGEGREETGINGVAIIKTIRKKGATERWVAMIEGAVGGIGTGEEVIEKEGALKRVGEGVIMIKIQIEVRRREIKGEGESSRTKKNLLMIETEMELGRTGNEEEKMGIEKGGLMKGTGEKREGGLKRIKADLIGTTEKGIGNSSEGEEEGVVGDGIIEVMIMTDMIKTTDLVPRYC